MAKPIAAPWLQYDRIAILKGQWWRILTGHWVHLGWPHLLLNIAGLFLIFGIFGNRLSRVMWTIGFLGCGVGTGLGLLAFNPGLSWYVGLSGVEHGVFALGLMESLRKARLPAAIGMLILIGKLSLEQIYGPTPGMATLVNSPTIVDAHLYGTMTGLLMGLSRWSRVTGKGGAKHAV